MFGLFRGRQDKGKEGKIKQEERKENREAKRRDQFQIINVNVICQSDREIVPSSSKQICQNLKPKLSMCSATLLIII